MVSVTGLPAGSATMRAAIAVAILASSVVAPARAQTMSGSGESADSSAASPFIDMSRAMQLYVSDRPENHPSSDYATDAREKARADSIFDALAAGIMEYSTIEFPSRAGDLQIPARVFKPLAPHPGSRALIWVHGGVHSHVAPDPYWPFIREAVERGFTVVAPDYRGSTGYGKAFHDAIDDGGLEVDDVLGAYDWIVRHEPHIDPGRVAIIGWSHGGLIALLAATREGQPFQAVAAIAPVSNLLLRLAYKGPAYQAYFSTQDHIRGLPFEVPATYMERSPVYHLDRINVPVLVHVATNDEDVAFLESDLLIQALRAKLPELSETRVYVDAPGGHMFSRLVDPLTLERRDTPEQRDSWNRVWAFLDWHLRDYDGR
ncbi:MAG TPA: alpha/beta fold hydrolase [Longimicrobiales bacterium]|nr:alpha/beta fold hydrolase [Longimicrobiales bacterium]